MTSKEKAHLIIGTAGHVDHGKTTLIKALTGFDCDTHPEEKKRGITINLGYTSLKLEDGFECGVIDMPGHQKFVQTMIEGASSTDLILFVVDAKNGIEAQTREHFEILKLLGTKRGIIVLTKADSATKEQIQATIKELKELVKSSFLESAPIKEVSALKNQGIKELLEEIKNQSQSITKKESGAFFKLFLDRCFSVPGRGTVVTGSVISGKLTPGADLKLLPHDKLKLKVKEIQKHAKPVEQVQSGDRAAINLSGFELGDFKRGLLLTDQSFTPTQIIDAVITPIQARKIKNHSFCIFHLYTQHVKAKLHVIDTLDQQIFVQIELDKKVYCHPKDHFILHATSKEGVLAGGQILDAHPLTHRKISTEIKNNLCALRDFSMSALLLNEISKRRKGMSLEEFQIETNFSTDSIKNQLTKSDDLIFDGDSKENFTSQKLVQISKSLILEHLKKYHESHPNAERGLSAKDLLLLSSDPVSIKVAISELASQNKIKLTHQTWTLSEFKSKASSLPLEKVSEILLSFQMNVPLMEQIQSKAKSLGITDKTLKESLAVLIQDKKIYSIQQSYIHAKIIDQARNLLLKTLLDKPNGITVAEFRDLIQGNRKISLLLFSQFDRERIIDRKEDYRVITQYGKEILEKANS